MVDYPTDMPIDSIRSLIDMIRTRSVDKSQLALAAWNVQGYLQSKMLDNPLPKIYGNASANPSNEEALIALQTLLDNHNDNTMVTTMNPLLSGALSLVFKWLIGQITDIVTK